MRNRFCDLFRMQRRPPPRLSAADYVGLRRYFLTICTQNRLEFFARADITEAAIWQLRQSSERQSFAVIAYCFMPDHLHLLVEALTDNADLRQFVRILKQRTAFEAKQKHGVTLWQRSYYEHVMRSEESALQKARYILANPVRAGLVESPLQYPWLGSFVTTVENLLQRCQDLDVRACPGGPT